MQQPINLHWTDIGAPFTDGAISEDELEHVIGGLARAWIEQLKPASARPEGGVVNLTWNAATAPSSAE